MLTSDSAKLKFIESIFGVGKLAKNRRNFDVRCPICDPADKSKRKLSICVENDRCHCWVCGYGSKSLSFLIKRYGTNAAYGEYREKFAAPAARLTKENFAEKLQFVRLPDDFQLLVQTPRSDPDVRAALRYVAARGLTERDLWYYKLGISSDYRWYRRVIMPSFDVAGNLNYYVARAIDKRRMPKYDNVDGNKLEIIFNEANIDWTQRLVLCEGPFDYVKCGDNAVPLLGSDLNVDSALFNAITVHSTPIALALDSDMRSSKMLVAAKKLIKYDIDVSLVDLGNFSDPGKMTRTEFSDALDRAIPYSWSHSIMLRLGDLQTRL